MGGFSRVLGLLINRCLEGRDQAIEEKLSNWKTGYFHGLLELLNFILRFSESFNVQFQVGFFGKYF